MSEATDDGFPHRLQAIARRIAEAARSAGRTADEVRLLPVSKTVEADRLREAVAAGCLRLGENKVQEAARKHAELADLSVEWAIIGHLQTNKARDVALFASEFQALDSLRLAETLDRRLQAAGRGLDVLVQVNTSGEQTKSGVAPQEALELLRSLRACQSLNVRGLMTLAVRSDDQDHVRACFRRLREIREMGRDEDLVGPGELSMGMSGDFELAIAEGSTCVRIGTAIFGQRQTKTASAMR